MLSKGFCDRQIDTDPFWNHRIVENPALIERIKILLDSDLCAMSFHEVVNLHRMSERTARLGGDIADAGVFFGLSTLVMALADPAGRRIHVFDTFEGIPTVTAGLDLVRPGDIRGGTLEQVKAVLGDFKDRVNFHPGIFPETTAEVAEDRRFSLVNLDMDVYGATAAALSYFYPRMLRGGAMVCHDYQSRSCPGIAKAVDEFFADKPETPVELWHTQVVIIKM